MKVRPGLGRPGRGLTAAVLSLSLSQPWAAPLPETGLDAAMLETFTAMVNGVRTRARDCGSAGVFGPAEPVSYDQRLAGASLAHLTDMIERNYFAHAGGPSPRYPLGSTLTERVRASGYPWRAGALGRGSAVEEVLGRGQRSFREVLDGWLASPSHCAALMSPSMRQFGVAVKVRADNVPLWAMLLGRPPH